MFCSSEKSTKYIYQSKSRVVCNSLLLRINKFELILYLGCIHTKSTKNKERNAKAYAKKEEEEEGGLEYKIYGVQDVKVRFQNGNWRREEAHSCKDAVV